MPPPLFDIPISVGSNKFTIRTAARTEPLAQVKLESLVQEIQSRLAKEASLHTPGERGILTERHAIASVTLLPKGRQYIHDAHVFLSSVDIVILAAVYHAPASPSTILGRVRSERAVPAYSPVELASRIERLAHSKLVELAR